MLHAWRRRKVITFCGYILGFPGDTPASIERDVKIIQRELPIDVVEFFILTPLPGSQDHKDLHTAGIWMDPDMNNYDLEHVTTAHPKMAKAELEEAYDRAWHTYYSWEHIEVLLRRAAADGMDLQLLTVMIFDFYASYMFEKIHPLQTGLFRRKVRTERRPGMQLESRLAFYPRRVREMLATYVPWFAYLWRLIRLRNRVQRDRSRDEYTDVAITPLDRAREDALAIFHVTAGARSAVRKAKNRAGIIAKARASAASQLV